MVMIAAATGGIENGVGQGTIEGVLRVDKGKIPGTCN
jgi:hypothetical protein